MPEASREDLRRRLDELEATVRGLTQEVVEANERLNELEADSAASEERATKPMPDRDETEPTADESTDDDPDGEGELDDIIVA